MNIAVVAGIVAWRMAVVSAIVYLVIENHQYWAIAMLLILFLPASISVTRTISNQKQE